MRDVQISDHLEDIPKVKDQQLEYHGDCLKRYILAVLKGEFDANSYLDQLKAKHKISAALSMIEEICHSTFPVQSQEQHAKEIIHILDRYNEAVEYQFNFVEGIQLFMQAVQLSDCVDRQDLCLLLDFNTPLIRDDSIYQVTPSEYLIGLQRNNN